MDPLHSGSNGFRGTANAEQKLHELKLRLIEMTDREKTLDEFETIMDRVEEVFLGNKAKADEFTAVHIAENPGPMHRCPRCGNTDPAFFRVDARNGDTICIGLNGEGCGEVVQDHNIFEGQQYRKLEDKEDKDHFGPRADPLMPQAHNMATNIVGMTGSDTLAKTLQNVSRYVEMNLSNIDSDERRTREGYKSNQKREAFSLMEHLAACLYIPTACVEQAKLIFAVYRHVKEAVHNFKAVVGACLALAYRELAKTVNLDESTVTTARPSAPRLAEIMAAMTQHEGSKILEVDTRTLPLDMRVNENLLIKDWTWEQVREWLYAIDEGRYRTQADAVFAYLQNTAAQNARRQQPQKLDGTLKEKKSLMFKRPIIAGGERAGKRVKGAAGQAREANVSATTDEDKSTLTPGQLLLSVVWEAATNGDTEASVAFRAALKRRREADVKLVLIEEENRLRMLSETHDRLTVLHKHEAQRLAAAARSTGEATPTTVATDASHQGVVPEITFDTEVPMVQHQRGNSHEIEIQIEF